MSRPGVAFLRAQGAAVSSVLDGQLARFIQTLSGFILSLWLWVPLHGILRMLGCLASGGEVTRFEISPLFGGKLLEVLFPWIVAAGDWTGGRAGFQPAGDFSYLATVLTPQLFLCPAGSALARLAVRRPLAWLFGVGLAGALQPLASATGDLYEAASIPLTRLAHLAGLRWAWILRGDDAFRVARHTASIDSPWAWVLFALGCIGAAWLAGIIFVLSGGIAPKEMGTEGRTEMAGSSGRWTRRSVLGVGLRMLSVGTGAWILAGNLFPHRLRPSEAETLNVLLDTLLPDGEFPGARRTGIISQLRLECEARRQTRRALREGLRLLDRTAIERGATGFSTLAPAQRNEAVEECANAEEGTWPRFFYVTVRDRAMRLHYAHPATWKPLRFAHPPQPGGYVDYVEKPDV